MPTKTFRNVALSMAGLSQDAGYEPCIIDISGADVVSATAIPLTAWTSAVVNLRYSDTREGPFTDYDTAATMTATDKGTGLQAATGRYAAIEVTTAEASVRADIVVTYKLSATAQGVGI